MSLLIKRDWKAIWDKKAEDSYCAITGGRNDKELLSMINTQVIEVMNFHREDIVLDMACGGGALVHEISIRAHKVIGIDLSKGMMSRAGSARNIRFIQADMQCLPFKNESFSKIICVSSLMYIPRNRLDAVFEELKRVLKTGGTVFFGQLLNKDRARKFFDFKGFNRPHSLSDLLEIMRKKIAFATGILALYSPSEITEHANGFGFGTQLLKGLSPQRIYKDDYFHFSMTLKKKENKLNPATSQSELPDLLCCPKCKKGVILNEPEKRIICSQCKIFFPIDSGIPLMVPDEARVL